MEFDDNLLSPKAANLTTELQTDLQQFVAPSRASTLQLESEVVSATSNQARIFSLDAATASVPIEGTPLNDILVGTNNSDTIFGSDGDDGIFSLDGNDTVFGGAGVDIIIGGGGGLRHCSRSRDASRRWIF